MPMFAGIKRIKVTVDNNDTNEFIKPFYYIKLTQFKNFSYQDLTLLMNN